MLDFGIARRVTEERAPIGAPTDPCHRILTPLYASPEQALRRRAGPPSDVYSLGVMLYELVAGRHPFALPAEEMPSVEAALEAHIGEEAKPLAEVGAGRDAPGLSDLVARMMAKDAEARPSAAAVYDALCTEMTGYATRYPQAKLQLVRPRDAEGDPVDTPP